MQSPVCATSRYYRMSFQVLGFVSALTDKFSYLQRNAFDNCLPSFDDNCVYASEFPDSWKNENLTEGWNLVKHPKFPPPPPPPSQTEDVEHWIRAMFIDATKN